MDNLSQCKRILAELKTNKTVPVYVFPMKLGILQYNARIKQLREQGHNIKNNVEIVDGVRHSTYSLVSGE